MHVLQVTEGTADYMDVEWYQLSLPFAISILYGYAITCGTALTIYCKSSDIWCNNCARAKLPRFCILQRWLKCVLLPPCFTEDSTLGVTLVAALKQTRTFRIPVFSGNILMVSAFEFQRFSLFSVKSLLICLPSWFRLSAMAENSPVESGFKGMTCSTPVNPFKQRKPFTSVWFVCLPVTKNGPSKSQISMPKPVCFARIDPSVNIGSASHPFQEISICHKEQLTRLYRTPCRNFLKEVLITWLTWGWETAGVTGQLSTCVVPFRRGLRHNTCGPVQNRNGQCVSNTTTAATNLTTETWWVWTTSNQPHTARKGERICQAPGLFQVWC